MGEVSWLPAEPVLPLPERYARLATTVRRALEDLAEHYEYVEKKFDDAAWVGARLTELLPIELADKQALLELEDPIERLDALADGGAGRQEMGTSLFRWRNVRTSAQFAPAAAGTTSTARTPITSVHASTIQPMKPS